MNVFWYVTSYK